MRGLQQITFEQLLDHYGKEGSEDREDAAWSIALSWNRYPDAEAMVVFENIQLDSSALGRATAVVVGPSNTYTSVDACEGRWINDLPSQRQYAQAFCVLPRPES